MQCGVRQQPGRCQTPSAHPSGGKIWVQSATRAGGPAVCSRCSVQHCPTLRQSKQQPLPQTTLKARFFISETIKPTSFDLRSSTTTPPTRAAIATETIPEAARHGSYAEAHPQLNKARVTRKHVSMGPTGTEEDGHIASHSNGPSNPTISRQTLHHLENPKTASSSRGWCFTVPSNVATHNEARSFHCKQKSSTIRARLLCSESAT